MAHLVTLRGNIEGDVMGLCCDGYIVCAKLVDHTTVFYDSLCPHQHHVNPAQPQHHLDPANF